MKNPLDVNMARDVLLLGPRLLFLRQHFMLRLAFRGLHFALLVFGTHSAAGQECLAGVPDCVDTQSGCYAWVISIDPFCCLANWDSGCSELYNHCSPDCLNEPGGPGDCQNLITGCTYPDACNYNPTAECPDGSCQMSGCMNPSACNYAPFAFCEGNSTCLYTTTCHSPYACNYDTSGCPGWEMCTFPGCTDPLAANFNPQAGCDDGSCLVVNCPSTEAFLWTHCYGNLASGVVAQFQALPGQEVTVQFVSGSIMPGDEIIVTSGAEVLFQGTGSLAGQVFVAGAPGISIEVVSDNFISCGSGHTQPLSVNVYCLQNEVDFGCYAPIACNFNPDTPYSGAVCLFPGCTQPDALNFDPGAGCDDGSCLIPGCNVPAACNFDPNATVLEEGSCDFSSCTCPADVNGDGYVNFPDLAAVLGSMGCLGSCEGDFNGNGMVDFSDILFFVQAFGGICD